MKNKLSRKENQKKLNQAFKILEKNIDIASNAKENPEIKQKNQANLKIFKQFVKKYIVMQNQYNIAMEKLGFAIEELDNSIVLLEKNIVTRVHKNLSHAKDYANQSFGKYVLKEDDSYVLELNDLCEISKNDDFSCQEVLNKVIPVKKHFEEIKNALMPNFFSLAYYQLNNPQTPDIPVEELNELTHKVLDDEFMLAYLQDLEKGVSNAFAEKNEAKKLAIEKMQEELKYLEEHDVLEYKEIKDRFNALFPY
ncbi:MAG: hypothetical protein K2I42_04145, partial [Anaeroplasmataceae bacterium]|nr:hypothetical protein [Anaeroplasmataceae bacterium]